MMDAHTEWAVVAEHLMSPSIVPLDAACIRMLALESELLGEGIPCVFTPHRPGEGFGYSRSVDQPIRLLVRGHDLPRAQRIAAELEAEESQGGPWERGDAEPET